MLQPVKIQQNVPLGPLTTLKIGGNARYFVRAKTEQQVAEAVKFASQNDLNLFILGGGSNVLVSDEGFDGVVLQIAILDIEHSESQVSKLRSEMTDANLETHKSALVTVGAGEDWDGFVEFCVKRDLAGIECLSGIPGFVGGTPVQNVGAYGQEVSETIVEVRCFDRNSREIITLGNPECGFSYRSSIFNSTYPERFIVLRVTFALRSGGKPKVAYKDLSEYFGDKLPTLVGVRRAVLKIRRAKSMVIDHTDANAKSVGSFFKNPIISSEKLGEIKTLCQPVPSFEYGEMFKIPAAWLIENAGFYKGFTLGKVGISANHTLALINRGDATAAEMIVLKERIQHAVSAKFGIELRPEPVLVGFSS